MNKHILINSYIRSGGSLMARLLDGHSLLRVLPVEMSYSKRKVVFPNFNKKLYSTEEFLEEIDLKRSFQKLDEKGVISKDPYGKQIIDFSYDEFIGELNKSIGNKAFTFSEGIDLVFINFFNNWKNYYARDLLQKKANEHVYVNHLSAACFADFSEYFDTFTNSIIIQTVRNPFAWYASAAAIVDNALGNKFVNSSVSMRSLFQTIEVSVTLRSSSFLAMDFIFSSPCARVSFALKTAASDCIVFCISRRKSAVGVLPFEYRRPSKRSKTLSIWLLSSDIDGALRSTTLPALIAEARPKTTRSINEFEPRRLAP